MNRIRRTPAQWKRLITTFESSGLKAVDFCKQHDVDQKYFSKKKNEIGLKPSKVNSFVKVAINNSKIDAPVLMILKNKNSHLNFYQLPDIEYLCKLMKSMS